VLKKIDKDFEKMKNEKYGLVKYVVKIGLFQFSFVYFLLFGFLAPFIDHNFTLEFIYAEKFSKYILKDAFLALFLGIFTSFFTWKKLQKHQ